MIKEGYVMEDLLFNESLNEPIFSILSKYTHTKGKFRCVYTNIVTKRVHHIVNNCIGGSMLLEGLYSVNDKQRVARYYFMNFNKTWKKANLEYGDVVEFDAAARLNWYGKEYSPLNPTRVINAYYRLVYPTSIKKIGHIDNYTCILNKALISTYTGRHYNNFYEYINDVSNNIGSDELLEMRLIQLVDSTVPRLILNRRNKVNCKNYAPPVILLETYNKLTDEQATAIDKIKVTISTLAKEELDSKFNVCSM